MDLYVLKLERKEEQERVRRRGEVTEQALTFTNKSKKKKSAFQESRSLGAQDEC